MKRDDMSIATWIELHSLDRMDRVAHGETVPSLPLTQFDMFQYQMQANRLRSLVKLPLLPMISINPPVNGKTPDVWNDFTDTAGGLYSFDMKTWCDILQCRYEREYYGWANATWSCRHLCSMQLNRIRKLQGLPERPVTYPGKRKLDIFS